jgi:hypothetical protein
MRQRASQSMMILTGWAEIALTAVVRMPLVLGLGDSAAAPELERRLETVLGELEI